MMGSNLELNVILKCSIGKKKLLSLYTILFLSKRFNKMNNLICSVFFSHQLYLEYNTKNKHAYISVNYTDM